LGISDIKNLIKQLIKKKYRRTYYWS
jgi:hypothetical protein